MEEKKKKETWNSIFKTERKFFPAPTAPARGDGGGGGSGRPPAHAPGVMSVSEERGRSVERGLGRPGIWELGVP